MTTTEGNFYVGLISGTSMDGIDAVVAKIDSDTIQLVASHDQAIPSKIQSTIQSLCTPGENEINRMGKLDNQLGELFATAAKTVINKAGLTANDIQAIGSHGQTIRHIPDGTHPFTLQIANPTVITELTDVTTIADFRRADMAAGGQGAPLVPAFHQAIFSTAESNRVVLNIGGIANISRLSGPNNINLTGFDTGPGNVLLNIWIKKHQNKDYDANGQWSSTENFDPQLLELMLRDPYFAMTPPKSTGREYFHEEWIDQCLNDFGKNISPAVAQSTFCELTAVSVINDIKQFAADCNELIVCGGGVHNADLMKRLQGHAAFPVTSSSKYGVDPDYVEAMAFAWLARQTLNNLPGNAPHVTGASHPAVLGAIYPRSPNGT